MAILCGACSFPVAAESWNRADGVRCPGCGERVRALVFPAIQGPRQGSAPESIEAAEEASCFFHPASRASLPCDECGRFLCSLCDIEIDARHLCPACFESGVTAKSIATLETQRTMYDSIALALATFPAMLIWPAAIGAPAALYVTIRRWRTPLSIVPRTRLRFLLAAAIALAEIAGIVVFIWFAARLPRARAVP